LRALPGVESVRGAGLMVACEVAGDAPELARRALFEQRLVINATGLGKDRPGSPLSDAAVFPQQGIAWDLNYRGELIFLAQARAQQAARHLHIEDGWVYFIHGWTQVIAEVFAIDIPTSGPGFEAISQLAAEAGRVA